MLAIEGLEREVNNGGYGQFFLNSSREFVEVIEEALLAVGWFFVPLANLSLLPGLQLAKQQELGSVPAE